MGLRSERVPLPVSRRHALYLIELIEDDLELDEETHFLKEDEREMSMSLRKRLEEALGDIQKRYERKNRSA